jgi:hypothetical protein
MMFIHIFCFDFSHQLVKIEFRRKNQLNIRLGRKFLKIFFPKILFIETKQKEFKCQSNHRCGRWPFAILQGAWLSLLCRKRLAFEQKNHLCIFRFLGHFRR